ncbi:MAG: hypothetical protein ACYC3S_11900 [Chloroflexota bacterium]
MANELGLPGCAGRERLGLDCDGVLANFASYMLVRLNKELGLNLRVPDWRPQPAEDDLGKAIEAAVWRMMDGTDLWSALAPYPGTARRVAALRERYDIYVVTAIPGRFAPVRAEWLSRHGVAHEGLVTVDTLEAKAGVARELGLCAFVEDVASTAEQLAAAGVDSYLIHRPWNADYPLKAGVRRGRWDRVLNWLLSRPATG